MKNKYTYTPNASFLCNKMLFPLSEICSCAIYHNCLRLCQIYSKLVTGATHLSSESEYVTMSHTYHKIYIFHFYITGSCTRFYNFPLQNSFDETILDHLRNREDYMDCRHLIHKYPSANIPGAIWNCKIWHSSKWKTRSFPSHALYLNIHDSHATRF